MHTIQDAKISNEILRIRKNAVAAQIDGVSIIKGGWKTKKEECVEIYFNLTCDFIGCIRATNSYADQMAGWLLKSAVDICKKKKLDGTKLIVSGDVWNYDGGKNKKDFDYIGIAPPKFESYLCNESEFLHGVTCHVFPMYGIEFRSDYSPKQYKGQVERRDQWSVYIANWNRVIRNK